jgi:hypothetical protein
MGECLISNQVRRGHRDWFIAFANFYDANLLTITELILPTGSPIVEWGRDVNSQFP